MPDLFGLDIAGIIADSIESAGGVLSGKLIKVTRGTRTSGSLAAGTNPTKKPFGFKGFYDDSRALKLPESLIQRGDRVVVLLGATIQSGAIPEPNDKIILEGEETTIDRIIDRDPAAATYTCLTRKT